MYMVPSAPITAEDKTASPVADSHRFNPVAPLPPPRPVLRMFARYFGHEELAKPGPPASTAIAMSAAPVTPAPSSDRLTRASPTARAVNTPSDESRAICEP